MTPDAYAASFLAIVGLGLGAIGGLLILLFKMAMGSFGEFRKEVKEDKDVLATILEKFGDKVVGLDKRVLVLETVGDATGRWPAKERRTNPR